MVRKKKKPEESNKHSKILKVAARMFMSHGYSQVSMDALADAVPVSKRTLYNHFEDKKALFTAVMQARCSKLFSKLEESINEKRGVEETLMSLALHFLDLVMEQDSINIYRTAITEAQHFPELGLLFYESGPKRSKEIMGRYFQTLGERGEFDFPNPELAAVIFLHMLKANFHMQRLLGVRKSVSDEEKNDTARYVVSVFLYGQPKKKKN